MDFEGKGENSILERVAAQPLKREKKYLGLTIEKDAEYVIDPEDYHTRKNHSRANGVTSISDEAYMFRQYIPIRDIYIDITKRYAKLCDDCFHRANFSATTSNLWKKRVDLLNHVPI